MSCDYRGGLISAADLGGLNTGVRFRLEGVQVLDPFRVELSILSGSSQLERLCNGPTVKVYWPFGNCYQLSYSEFTTSPFSLVRVKWCGLNAIALPIAMCNGSVIQVTGGSLSTLSKSGQSYVIIMLSS